MGKKELIFYSGVDNKELSPELKQKTKHTKQ